ncbi:MFS transporter [Microbulbifer sp. THAF38]|uniref:MFS transporter n=1 Tax=Microbulbifer sp. THAF38 TaxID=2587856 RepID=UPI0012A8B7BA|nr:MFS transporter [Microbulbifer sp. THAF38]QFT53578.1 Lysophospholipid transporter LplT [Microbulbifer sp. THAF38]
MARQNQFQLLRKRRFLPLFLTLISIYFNSNLFRNALLVIFAFHLAKAEANALINLATGLYLLPFFLFSITAGQLADRYDKSKLLKLIKLLEIPIVLLGAFAIYISNTPLSFFVLFLLASHEAFYSPVRYAIMPQHLKRQELMGGNGVTQMGMFAGALGGAIAGTLIADFMKPGQHGVLYLTLIMLLIAIFGYLSSRAIPLAPPVTPHLKINWNPAKQTLQILHQSMKNPAIFYSIIASSWFWLISTTFSAQLPSFTKNTLGASEMVVTLMICCLTVGVALGSLICEGLSKGRITFGIVPIGGIGITLGGLGLGFSAMEFHTLSGAGITEFLRSDGSFPILLYTVLVGFCGGIYIVPLYTIIQDRAEKQLRGQILALSNMFFALFVMLVCLLNIYLLDIVKITIPQLFIFTSILNFLTLAFICLKLPELLVHQITWIYSNLLTRVRSKSLEQVPSKEAALLICDSTDYRAPLLIYDTLPRPVRFILSQSLYKNKVLRFSLNKGGTPPIIYATKEMTEDNLALAEIEKSAQSGELLCLMLDQIVPSQPSNRLKMPLDEFLRHLAIPIIPLIIQSKKAASKLSGKVFLAAEEPLSGDNITHQGLYQTLYQAKSTSIKTKF